MFIVSSSILDFVYDFSKYYKYLYFFFLSVEIYFEKYAQFGKTDHKSTKSRQFGGDVRDVDLFKFRKMAVPFCSF